MPEGTPNISDGMKRWTVLKVCTGGAPVPISILCVCVVLPRCCAFYRSLFPNCSHFLSTAFFGSNLQMREISDRPHSSFGVCGLFLWWTSTYLSNGSDDFRKIGLTIDWKCPLLFPHTRYHPVAGMYTLTVNRRESFKRQWFQSTRVTLIFIKSFKMGAVMENRVFLFDKWCVWESGCARACV